MFMSLYYKVISLIIALVIWFGFVGPYCVSSKANELVIGWYAVTIILAPVFVKTVYNIIKNFIERISNES